MPIAPFQSPNNVPIIGQPRVLTSSVLVTIECPCEAKLAITLMALPPQPLFCVACKQGWLAQMLPNGQLNIQRLARGTAQDN